MSATTSPSAAGASPSVVPTGSAAQYELLSPLTPAGLDLAAARQQVDAAAAVRRRGRRILAGSCAALVVIVGCVAVSLLSGTDPDDIVADGDRDERSTTTLTSTTVAELTNEIAAVPESTLASVLPTTTLVTTTVPVTTLAPATTAAPLPAPNQPMVAELTVVTPTPEAGDVAIVDLAWRDADHGGVAPHVSVDWGDPAVSVDSTVPPSGPCDVPGAPSGGTDRLQFRYATPGVHDIGVTLSTCDGLGAYGERVRVTARVVVGEPAGSAERAVVAFVPRQVGGQELPLDAAVAEFVAEDSTASPLAARTPVLAQFTAAGTATVLRVPVGARGTLRLTWTEPNCTATGAIDLSTAPTDRAPQIQLTLSC